MDFKIKSEAAMSQESQYLITCLEEPTNNLGLGDIEGKGQCELLIEFAVVHFIEVDSSFCLVTPLPLPAHFPILSCLFLIAVTPSLPTRPFPMFLLFCFVQ